MTLAIRPLLWTSAAFNLGGALLFFADSGPGIPVEERKRVFERLYRLDHSRQTPGLGLGLSLVKAIADLHQASIVLEDNRPGVRLEVSSAKPAA